MSEHSHYTIHPFMTPINVEPPTCPECGKIESVKRVCRHCGFEYADSPWSTRKIVLATLAAIVGLWVFITLIYWVHEAATSWRPDSLVDILGKQWKFISSLKVW